MSCDLPQQGASLQVLPFLHPLPVEALNTAISLVYPLAWPWVYPVPGQGPLASKKVKKGQTCIEIWPVQQVSAKFRSMYGDSGHTEVDLPMNFCTTGLLG